MSAPSLVRVAQFVLALLLAAVAHSVATAADEAVLEHYSIKVGADDAAGVRVVLLDPHFGRGTAQSRLVFTGPDGAATPSLFLRVWRNVPDGQITFALLVFRVEIRGFDAGGSLVYSRRLAGFTFGDSASGEWRRTIADLPAEIQRIVVVFVGNYE